MAKAQHQHWLSLIVIFKQQTTSARKFTSEVLKNCWTKCENGFLLTVALCSTKTFSNCSNFVLFNKKQKPKKTTDLYISLVLRQLNALTPLTVAVKTVSQNIKYCI